jgi:hypothetical protein
MEVHPPGTVWQALTAQAPLHKELRDIFKKFGFETSKLA